MLSYGRGTREGGEWAGGGTTEEQRTDLEGVLEPSFEAFEVEMTREDVIRDSSSAESGRKGGSSASKSTGRRRAAEELTTRFQ